MFAELRRELEHLSVLLAIRSRRDEEQEEDDLAKALLLLLLGFWNDEYTASEFKRLFLNELKTAFEKLDPDGLYGEWIDSEVARQSGYLENFIRDIRNDTQSEAQARHRSQMYAGSLGSLRERIELGNLGDQLMTWRWDESLEIERHCVSCKDLNGVTKKASEWARMDLHPRSIQLDCGYACHCTLS